MAMESIPAREAAGQRARTGPRRLAVSLLVVTRRVPLPLGLLSGVAVVAALAWAIVLPPLQGPDEVSHFAYAQTIAETGSIPWHLREPASPGNAYSTEVAVASRCSGITGLAQNLSARAAASPLDERVCYAELGRLPHGARSDGGFTSAEKNPPLYYLYESVPYLMFHGSTFFTRSFAMRLANLPLLVALVAFVWLLAGELLLGLPHGAALRSLATAAAVLNPQTTMAAATISPDVLLAMLWTAGLWLAVSVVRHGATRTRIAWLVCVCVAAALTQGRGLALLAAAAIALTAVAWRRYRPRGRAAAAAIASALLATCAAAFLIVRYAVRDDLTLPRVRQFASYLWQFYLPRIGSMKPTIHPGYGVRQVFIDRFLGTFGQLEITFSPSTLDFLSRAAEVTAVAVLIGLVVHRRRLVHAGWVIAVLAIPTLGYLFQLHAVAWSSLLNFSGDPIITGRYLLPLLALYGIGIALALSWLPRRIMAALIGAVVAGLVVLQVGALAIVAERFYA
jgi:hypothetical protein